MRYTSRSDIGYLRHAPDDVKAQIEFVFGDLRDENAVEQALRGMEAVFHLGALIAVPYSYLHPREVVETNVIGTLNVLMAAIQHKTSRIVHTSTSEVYGTALCVPIDERHPLQSQSPYSASKTGADKLVESFVRSYGVPAVTIRPFNTYGPRQSARAVIPAIISQGLSCGTIHLGELTPTRDFTYVSDTVDGFVRAGTADAVIGETINLGNDFEISIGELARLIIELLDRPLQLKVDQVRMRPPASEVRQLHADNRRAKAMLGWSPTTSLEEGLRKTIDWVRAHPEHFAPGRYSV